MCVCSSWVGQNGYGKSAEEELGSSGDVTVKEAAQHMVEIMMNSTEEHTGMYLTKDMEKLPY